MARKNAFVKVSGDQFQNPGFIGWIKELSREWHAVICIGGGTQVNEEFARRGFKTRFGPLGRETETLDERQVARDILETNAAECEDLLAGQSVYARVMIPVLDIGGVLCHVNGDEMVRTAYLGYDQLFIITTPERLETKRQIFADLPKVEVRAF